MNCKNCGKKVENNNELCEECLKKLNAKNSDGKSANQKLNLDLDCIDFSPSEFFSGDFSNETPVHEPIDKSTEISVKKIQAPSAKKMVKPSEMKILPVGTSFPPEEPTLNLEATPILEKLQQANSSTDKSSSDVIKSNSKTQANDKPKIENIINNLQQKETTKKSKLIPILAVFAALILIIGAGAFYLAKSGSKEINLNNYVSINFKGYAGHGIPAYTVDYLKLNSDLSGKTIDVSDEDTDILDGVLADSEYHDFLASIACSFDKESSLNTGDNITATITYDKKLAEKLQISFTSSPISVVVDALPTTRDLDPFTDIQLAFNGVSPYATVDVTVDSKDEVYEALSFSCDKTKNIKNGDKITVTVNYKNDNYLLENYGYKLSATSQVFECTGLDSYLSSVSDFSDTMLGQLQSAATKVISDYQTELKDTITISDINYAGYYLLIAKKAVKGGDLEYNTFYALYSAKVYGSNITSTTVYFPVKFSNIIILGDGTSDITKDEAEIVGTTSLTYQSGKKVKGYTNISTMKSNLANTKNGVYTLKVLEIKPEIPKTQKPKKTQQPEKPTRKPAPNPPMVQVTKAPRKTAIPPEFVIEN